MTDQLKSMIASTIAAESSRFSEEHGADDAVAYRRSVASRRTSRRLLESAGALAVVGVVALGVYAGVHATARSLPVDPVSSPETAPGPYDRALTLTGRTFLQGESAGTLLEAYDGLVAGEPGCQDLDGYARLEDPVSGEGAVAPGVFQAWDGSRTGLYVRDFATAEEAQGYLGAAQVAAVRCGQDADASGVTVTTSTAGVGSIGGGGVRIVVTPPGLADGEWLLRLHVVDGQVLAVVSEPGADDVSAQLVKEWFSYGG